MTEETQARDCSWCGAEIETPPHATPMSRRGEEFCSRAHRDASARAVKALRDTEDRPMTDTSTWPVDQQLSFRCVQLNMGMVPDHERSLVELALAAGGYRKRGDRWKRGDTPKDPPDPGRISLPFGMWSTWDSPTLVEGGGSVHLPTFDPDTGQPLTVSSSVSGGGVQAIRDVVVGLLAHEVDHFLRVDGELFRDAHGGTADRCFECGRKY